MIKSFRHKGIEDFFETGSLRGIQAKHAFKLKVQLTQLNVSASPQEMFANGWDLHALKGNLAGHWAVSVSGNWRLIFSFDEVDAILVDYRDYH